MSACATVLPVRKTEKRENLGNRCCLLVIEVEKPAVMLQRDRLNMSVSVDIVLMFCTLLRNCRVLYAEFQH